MEQKEQPPTEQPPQQQEDNQSNSSEEEQVKSGSKIMKFLFFLIVVAGCALAYLEYTHVQEISQQEEQSGPYYEDGVLVVKSSYFEEVLKQHKLIMLEFYAPWCGHCKKLAPEYAAAAKLLAIQKTGITLAKIDATVEKELASKYDVEGYPTLKFIKDGEVIDYKGKRTSDDIVNWCKKKIGPPSEQVKDSEELNNLIENKSVLVVYFGEDNDNFKTFQQIAAKQDQFDYAHTFSNEIKASHHIENSVQIVLFTKYDERKHSYNGELSYDAILEFIKTYSNPIVMGFDSQAIDLIFTQQNTAVILFTNDDNEEFQQVYQKIALEFRSNLKFTFIKPSDSLFQKLADYVGGSQTELPNVVIYKSKDQSQKYKLTGELKEDTLRQFVQDFIDGKLQPHYKSQDIPEKNDDFVKVIVGKSFDQLVINSTQDVFVKFYAPWCGHCKKIAPIIDDLGYKLSNNPNLVIAKFDSTENEVPYVTIASFPTLYFFKNGKKNEPIKFSGDRTEEGFLSFLKNETSYEWVEPLEKKQEEDKEKVADQESQQKVEL